MHMRNHTSPKKYLDLYESFIEAEGPFVPSVVDDLHEIAERCKAAIKGDHRDFDRNARLAWQIAKKLYDTCEDDEDLREFLAEFFNVAERAEAQPGPLRRLAA